MALSPAEKQSRYRDRQRIKAETLAAEVERLRAAPAQPQQPQQPQPQKDLGPNLGPKTPLTPDEVDYLRPLLRKHRAWLVERNASLTRQQADTDAAPPEVKEQIAQKKARAAQREATIAANKIKLDATRPTPGTYWCTKFSIRSRGVEFVPFEIVEGARGGLFSVIDGITSPLGRANGEWTLSNGQPFATTKEAMEEYIAAKHEESRQARENTEKRRNRPLKDKTDAELKRLRSINHPDKGGDHDPKLYQQAVEEIDHRRAAKG